MAKGRDSNFYRHGMLAGWADFRYGVKPKPVTLAGPKPHPALGVKKHQHVVHGVIDRLRAWQSSPFENEAAIRHGLREALVLTGHGWAISDAEAESIVAEAFRAIGVRRPTWSEGQPYYSVSPDFCPRCLSPLDDEVVARGGRFCSSLCAKSVIEHSAGERIYYVDGVQRSARRLIAREKAPPRLCGYCGVEFKNTVHSVRFCSAYCGTLAAKGDRLLSKIICEGCAKEFQPTSRATRFCSRSCSRPATVLAKIIELWGVERICGCCATAFKPGTERAIYCSRKCAKAMARRAAEARNPRKPPLYSRECTFCGQPFTTRDARQTRCSKRCINLASQFRTGSPPVRITPPVFDFVMRIAA